MSLMRTTVVFIFGATLAIAPALAERHTHHSSSAATHSSHKKTATKASASSSTKSSAKSAKSSKSSRSAKSSRSSKAVKVSKRTKTSGSRRLHGQQSIDSSRVIEIQQALIREHYLTTEANGVWDTTTISAMQKYQADQGWQTKLMPDSRALKKLGLGPDYSNAINASGSSFAAPAVTGSTPVRQADDFAAAAGVSH
jgi:peptidoglycan hydrolase-like protein with peptidoglycan-binding domain